VGYQIAFNGSQQYLKPVDSTPCVTGFMGLKSPLGTEYLFQRGLCADF